MDLSKRVMTTVLDLLETVFLPFPYLWGLYLIIIGKSVSPKLLKVPWSSQRLDGGSLQAPTRQRADLVYYDRCVLFRCGFKTVERHDPSLPVTSSSSVRCLGLLEHDLVSLLSSTLIERTSTMGRRQIYPMMSTSCFHSARQAWQILDLSLPDNNTN